MNRIRSIAGCVACLFIMMELYSAKTAAAADRYTAKVYTNSLIVRSEPAKSAAIKTSLKSGALVTVTDEQHGWVKINTGKVSGWVAGYYLKRVNSPATTSASPPTVKTSSKSTVRSKATVAADSLRIRGGPGTRYKVLGSLKAEDSVTVLLRQGDWLRIRTASGEIGWVAGQYIREGKSAISQASSPASSPNRSAGSIKGKLIVVDPGHGGSDPGMLGTTYNTMEKDLNLQTAFYVRDYLQAKGARVEMTRTRDRKPTLVQRVQISHNLGADAFVSIHYNSSPKKVSGTLTFYYSESDDLKLARAIEQRLGVGIGLRNNGLSFGDYHILRENRTPAALVELGFLTNPKDEALVRKSSYQKKAAKAIADGLADYFRS